MRDALYRLTSPILDRIPDISHQPKGRQISIGLAASLLFHVLLLMLALLVGIILPKRSLVSFAAAKPKLQEIEITVLPPAPAQEMRVVPLDEPPPFIDSRGLAATETAPEKADFQSGKDMRAASEKAATGALPLPSQEGRVLALAPEFEQKNLTLGAGLAPKANEPPPPKASETPPPPERATESVESKPAPQIAPKEAPGAEKPATLAEPAKPRDDEIAMEVTPKAGPAPKFRNRTEPQLAMLPTPVPERTRPEEPSFQPQAEKTQVEGSISNRGRNAVNAKGTPLGRYYEAVGRTISSRWNYYVKGKGDLLAIGSVRTVFTIDRKGRVSNVHSEENTSNDAFAFVCERSVLESQLPPPGRDIANVLADGKLDITFTFTLY